MMNYNIFKGCVEVKINNFDKAKIIPQLINTEWNKEMLKNMPHRNFLDLSVIYLYVFEKTETGCKTAKITNQLAAHMGLNEQQLFKLAMENKDTMFKNMTISMYPMIVITNKDMLYGATKLLEPSNLIEIANEFDSDLYIFPSSIHEIIVCPVSLLGKYEALELVRSVNQEVVDVKDRLSDNCYYYSREKRELLLID